MFKNQKFFMSLFCVVGLGFAQVAWAPEGDDETDLDLDPDWDLVDSSRDGIGAKSMSVKTAANAPEENDDWNLVDPWQARVNSEYFSQETAPERKAELVKIAQNEVEKAQLRDANFKNYLASGLANPVQVSAFSGTDSMIFSKDPVEKDPDADRDLDIQSNAEAKQIAKKAGQMAEEAQQRSSIKDEQDSDAAQIQKKMQAEQAKIQAGKAPLHAQNDRLIKTLTEEKSSIERSLGILRSKILEKIKPIGYKKMNP